MQSVCSVVQCSAHLAHISPNPVLLIQRYPGAGPGGSRAQLVTDYYNRKAAPDRQRTFSSVEARMTLLKVRALSIHTTYHDATITPVPAATVTTAMVMHALVRVHPGAVVGRWSTHGSGSV
jgi:hypothetical protein